MGCLRRGQEALPVQPYWIPTAATAWRKGRLAALAGAATKGRWKDPARRSVCMSACGEQSAHKGLLGEGALEKHPPRTPTATATAAATATATATATARELVTRSPRGDGSVMSFVMSFTADDIGPKM